MSKEKTKKLTPREGRMAVGLIFMTAVIAFLIYGIAKLYNENAKYDAILEMSCNQMYNPAQCREGMRLLKGMSIEDIKNYNTKK